MDMQKDFAVWDAACGILKKRLSKDVFERWIAVIRPQSLDERELVLTVANDFYLSWLEENYLPLIRKALAAAGGACLRVSLRVDANRATPVPPRPERVAASRPRQEKNRLIGSPLCPHLSFSTFVVGPSNNFAHASALAVAQSPGRAFNPLLIYGGSGVGKTHLLHAIGRHVYETGSARVCYVSSETFLNDFIDSLLPNRMRGFREKYRSADLLLIDDVHFFASKDRIMEEFFHTFNDLIVLGRQIVLTCDRPAAEVKGLQQRLVSRLQWGQVTQIEPPDLEVRLAILRQKQKAMSVALPDDVLLFIAERIRRDVRTLEGALTRMVSYASLCPGPVARADAGRLLRDILDSETAAVPTVEAIQKAVAEQFDIRLADMTSKRRPQSVAFPRQVAMFLCRTLTQQSLPAIGAAFNRNHATVLHAYRAVSRREKQDEPFRQTLSAIRRRLGQDRFP